MTATPATPAAGTPTPATPTRSRVPFAFLAWSRVSGRSEEIAAALGGEARCFWISGLRRKQLVPLRYLLSAVGTAAYLLRARPRAVAVTNPPVFPGLIALAYARFARVPVLLDSHPASFGAKDNAVAARLLPVHRWMARRSASVLVTTDDWVRTVESWGGRATVVHEAPPLWEVAPPRPLPARPRVLFVGVFAPDEPVAEVLAAARLLPEADVVVTGDLQKCSPALRESAPANVSFVGFLSKEEYRRAVEDCDVLLALTTEPTSVVRAGYEAVYARRPLVVTGWPELRRLFPHAVPTGNDAAGIAAALRTALAEHERLRSETGTALEDQRDRWDGQVAELRALTAG